MALAQRIAALQKRHEWLDQILAQEMVHRHPDESRLTQIKKSKLRVKDEIASLEGVLRRITPVNDEEGEYQWRRHAH